MKRLLFATVFFATCLLPTSANAVWTGASGKVVDIVVYATTDTVLFVLDVSGADVAECSNKTTFAINGSLPTDRRKQMLSVLLLAKTTGEEISVGFNVVGGCVPWGSTQNVYRGVARITL